MSQVGGQVDALTLTAGEGVGESVERKIPQTNIQEELQAVGDFGEQALADFLLMLRDFQFLEPFAQVHNRHLNQFGDALSANLYIVGFLLESGTMQSGQIVFPRNRLSITRYCILYWFSFTILKNSSMLTLSCCLRFFSPGRPCHSQSFCC